MKTIVVLIVVLLSHIAVGQNLPIVVDNSRWFPPAGTQYWNSCHVYSMTSYLKSYWWNKNQGRDPNLPENQFSPYFVWDLDINPIGHWMESYSNFSFMKQQGCASLVEFTSSGDDQDVIPDLTSREKALFYKSKKLSVKDLGVHTEEQAEEYLKALKDSLYRGVCFTLHFPLFSSINNLYNSPENANIYSYEGNVLSDMVYTHVAVVVGYNDTIKTKHGKGALKILNSWGESFGNKGYFYLDYGWFKILDWNFPCYFLEEDFDQRPELYLSLNLTQAITGENIQNGEYLFVDTCFYGEGGDKDKKYDFSDLDYYYRGKNLVKVKDINKEKNALFNEIIYINRHDHDGGHSIISDLTDYIKAENFKSMQIILQDPISSTYIDGSNKIIYSYTRQAKANIINSFVKFIGTDKKIMAKVKDLPDTTVIVKDFYSRRVGFALRPQVFSDVYIKSCTSILKRKLITFSIEDLKTDTPPVWVATPTSVGSVYENSDYNFQFKAQDEESSPITYSLVGGDGASIDPVSGLFSYKNSKAGIYSFTVKACDGISDIIHTFSVKILSNTLPQFTSEPTSPVTVEAGKEFKFKFVAIDPQGKTIAYHVATANTGRINATSGDYSYIPNTLGSVGVEVWAMNGVETAYSVFTIIVVPSTNTAPVFLEQPITIDGVVNKEGEYQLEATDKENDPLTFAIVNPLPGVSVSRSGKINYKLPFGTYKFSVKVSDGKDSSIAAVTAKIDITNAAEDISEADYNVRAYPNPVHSNTTIEIFMKKSATATIAIIDLSGRQVDMMQVDCVAGENKIDYDASSLRSGTYVCKVNAADYFSKSIKIIKQ